uniref:Uncharacterized protein n=1 Tax=Myoviridae sp. ctCdG12 TaxID=2825052 RepID=A0A8S5U2M8_9CAUD|nr:MAG TPA: hypothetical protein [Myoviridae sp. ctCdG12]
MCKNICVIPLIHCHSWDYGFLTGLDKSPLYAQ